MAFAGILDAADVKAAVAACAAAESFDYKSFFVKAGLATKSNELITKAFYIVDADKSGFIEEEELNLFLKSFDAAARLLTPAETKKFLAAGDADGDGMIGVDEFIQLVKA